MQCFSGHYWTKLSSYLHSSTFLLSETKNSQTSPQTIFPAEYSSLYLHLPQQSSIYVIELYQITANPFQYGVYLSVFFKRLTLCIQSKQLEPQKRDYYAVRKRWGQLVLFFFVSKSSYCMFNPSANTNVK